MTTEHIFILCFVLAIAHAAVLMAANAPNVDIFVALFGNGPVDTGNSAGVETYLSSADGATRGKSIKGTFLATLSAILEQNEEPHRGHLAVAGAAALAHHGSFCNVFNWSLDGENAADDAAFDAAEYTDDDLRSAISDAIALIAATKVNWWKGNHHTGGEIARGFVARLLSIFKVNKIDEKLTRSIWCAGHWFSTKSWLGALGVPGIADDGATRLAARLKVDDAVAKRIRSGPAGTAAFEAVYAGIIAVGSHPVVGYAAAPQLPALSIWRAAHEDIARAPAKYHIGAQYLTGAQRVAVPVVPDPVISFVYTAIRFYNRDASLLRAAVFNNVAEDNTALAAFRSAGTFETKERAHVGVNEWITADVSAAKGSK